MNEREWLSARTTLCAANRERVEHLLAEFYAQMGWQGFEYVIYTQSPRHYLDATRWRSFGRWSPPYSAVPQEYQGALNSFNARACTECVDPWRDLLREPRVLGVWRPTESNPLLEALATETLDFAPMRKRPYVLEKPLEAHFNADGRPHCPDGPAVIWRNGMREYWWNGVRATRRFIEDEPTLSYIRNQRNAERRRVLIERYGEGRYLVARGAYLRSEDEYGKLWVVRIQPHYGHYWTGRTMQYGRLNEDEVFVEVTNSTPEPDGSYRKFFLRVPPHMKTPKQAVAWSFKLSRGPSYEPVKQT